MKVYIGISRKALEMMKGTYPKGSGVTTSVDKARRYASPKLGMKDEGVILEFEVSEKILTFYPKTKDEYRTTKDIDISKAKEVEVIGLKKKSLKEIYESMPHVVALKEGKYPFSQEVAISSDKWPDEGAKRVAGQLEKKYGRTGWFWSKMQKGKLKISAETEEKLKKLVADAEKIIKSGYEYQNEII